MVNRRKRLAGILAKSNGKRTNLFPVIAYATVTAMLITIFRQSPPISLEQDAPNPIRQPTSMVEQRTTAIPNKCDSPARPSFDEKYRIGGWSQKMKSPDDFYGDSQWPPKPIRQRSASGKGSWLGYTTETSLQILKETIRKHNIKSMVDIPCRDVNWIFDSFETDSLPFYVGLDVVSAVIEVNKKQFAHTRIRNSISGMLVIAPFPTS